MMSLSIPMQAVLTGVLVILGLLLLLALLYAIISHRFTDKIVAANMIGSLSLLIIVIFAIFFEEDYILDIGIVLALLSFLGVIVLCRVVTDHIFGQLRHLQDKNKEAVAHIGTEHARVHPHRKHAPAAPKHSGEGHTAKPHPTVESAETVLAAVESTAPVAPCADAPSNKEETL